MTDLIKRYLACWNETDANTRRRLIDELWVADAEYVDPVVEARGRDEIAATIAAVQSQFDGFVFKQVGVADSHHHQTRFSWGLGPVDADPIVVGLDVAVTDEAGRITTVFGFLDQVPSA